MRKSYSVLIFALLFIAVNSSASSFERKIELTQDFEPNVKSGVADLFIPLPLKSTDYQNLVQESHQSNATWVKEETIAEKDSKDRVRVLHAHWDKVDQPKLHVHQILKLNDRNSGTAENSADSRYLQATEHVQTDGIVLETANKITKNLADPDKKAEAIYNWIVENSFRDPKTRGCGFGDVKSILASGNLGGKCADLNSLFVGLARASGIPARDVWGLRVDASRQSKSLGREGDISKSQHCRAEYYSTNQKAWIPVDPADVRKVILEENLSLTDSHVKEIRAKFFGNWEGNWVAFNYGRDFELSNGKKINFLMYPQLTSASLAPDGIDPTETGYKLISKLLDSFQKNN